MTDTTQPTTAPTGATGISLPATPGADAPPPGIPLARLDPDPVPEPPPSRPLTSPQRWMAVGAVAFALLCAAVGLWRYTHPQGPVLPPVPKVSLPAPVEPTPSPVVTLAGCQIVGDSIALGLAQTETFKIVCEHAAKVGIPAWDVVDLLVPGKALYIVSAGSNQPTDERTPAALAAIRKRITNTGSKVVWVLPVNPTARAAAAAIASSLGDVTVTFTPGKDRVHPVSYDALAKLIVGKVP